MTFLKLDSHGKSKRNNTNIRPFYFLPWICDLSVNAVPSTNVRRIIRKHFFSRRSCARVTWRWKKIEKKLYRTSIWIKYQNLNKPIPLITVGHPFSLSKSGRQRKKTRMVSHALQRLLWRWEMILIRRTGACDFWIDAVGFNYIIWMNKRGERETLSQSLGGFMFQRCFNFGGFVDH